MTKLRPQICPVVAGLWLAAALGLLALPAAAAGRSETDKSQPASSHAAKDASAYVGAETCKTCHEEIYNAWAKTPHWKTTLNKEPSHQGCEGC
ncbi:MAG: hypothetical protein WAM04_08850, partial [Candidatus Sulfotelmatobacter sp.]